jgi:hypothetical protein
MHQPRAGVRSWPDAAETRPGVGETGLRRSVFKALLDLRVSPRQRDS